MPRVLSPVTNFAEVIPTGTYSAVDTSINLTTGEGGLLPDTTDGAFNLVWFNSTDYSGPALDPQKEIIRVVTRTVDVLTVLRGQEGTTASTKNIAGKVYKLSLAVTKRMIDDINTQLELDKALTDAIGTGGFPSQTGNAGKVLTTDGTLLSWQTAGGGGSGVTSVVNGGTGAGQVGANVTGTVLNLRTIKAGANITVTQVGNDITIAGTGGGGGGDVTAAGNNAFTGDNTHSGTETFTGTVDLSGATVVNPSATSGTTTNNSTTTYSATSTSTYAALSTSTWADGSIISNQATETFGAGYAGTYQSGSSVTVDSGATTTFNNRPVFNGGLTVPTGTDITVTDAPVDGTDVANKAYVDSVAGGGGGGAHKIVGFGGNVAVSIGQTTVDLVYTHGASFTPTKATIFASGTDAASGNPQSWHAITKLASPAVNTSLGLKYNHGGTPSYITVPTMLSGAFTECWDQSMAGSSGIQFFQMYIVASDATTITFRATRTNTANSGTFSFGNNGESNILLLE